MVRGRRLLGQLVLVLAMMAAGFVGARLGVLGTREVGASHNFSDVPDSAFYHDFVQFLVDAGITSGCSVAPPLYCGEDPVTRGQIAVFLQRLTALSCLRREENEVIFEGCNVHIRSGAGATDAAVNGLGNLIIGYKEPDSAPADVRTGSHNLVVGPRHTYSSFGGLVAGSDNAVSGPNASVSADASNRASGQGASISGGANNTASGPFSSVSAGTNNVASGGSSSISGGQLNTAAGGAASISGGTNNTVSGVVPALAAGRATRLSAAMPALAAANSARRWVTSTGWRAASSKTTERTPTHHGGTP